MARLPNIRVSYTDDARFMLRLINAVERDTARSARWREGIIEDLRNLSQKLMAAPKPNGKGE